MKRMLVLLAIGLGCGQVTSPTPTLRFALTTIDSHPLPWVPAGGSGNLAIQSGELDFGSIAGLTNGAQGIVAYTTKVAGQTATTRHSFGVSGSTLRINLCPIGASCTAVVTEFVGPVSVSTLDLTYTVGVTAASISSIYRFTASVN